MNIAASLPASVPDAPAGVASAPGAEFPDMFAALLAAPAASPVASVAAASPTPVCIAPSIVSLPASAPPVDLETTPQPKPDTDDTGDTDLEVDPLAVVATALAEPVRPPFLLAVQPVTLASGVPAPSVDTETSGIATPDAAPLVAPSARASLRIAATLETTPNISQAMAPVISSRTAPATAPTIVMPATASAEPTAKTAVSSAPLLRRPVLMLEPAPLADASASDPVDPPVRAPQTTPAPVEAQKSATQTLAAQTPVATTLNAAVPAPPPPASDTTPVPDARPAIPATVLRAPRGRDPRVDLPASSAVPAYAPLYAAHDAAPVFTTAAPRATSHDPDPAPVTAEIIDTGPGSFDLATDRLGAVRVAIEAREARVGVQFTVDTSAAASLLGGQPARLADAVATSGNRFDGVSVDVRSGGGEGNSAGRQPAERREPARSVAVESRPIPRALRADRYA